MLALEVNDEFVSGFGLGLLVLEREKNTFRVLGFGFLVLSGVEGWVSGWVNFEEIRNDN